MNKISSSQLEVTFVLIASMALVACGAEQPRQYRSTLQLQSQRIQWQCARWWGQLIVRVTTAMPGGISFNLPVTSYRNHGLLQLI